MIARACDGKALPPSQVLRIIDHYNGLLLKQRETITRIRECLETMGAVQADGSL